MGLRGLCPSPRERGRSRHTAPRSVKVWARGSVMLTARAACTQVHTHTRVYLSAGVGHSKFSSQTQKCSFFIFLNVFIDTGHYETVN